MNPPLPLPYDPIPTEPDPVTGVGSGPAPAAGFVMLGGNTYKRVPRPESLPQIPNNPFEELFGIFYLDGEYNPAAFPKESPFPPGNPADAPGVPGPLPTEPIIFTVAESGFPAGESESSLLASKGGPFVENSPTGEIYHYVVFPGREGEDGLPRPFEPLVLPAVDILGAAYNPNAFPKDCGFRDPHECFVIIPAADA